MRGRVWRAIEEIVKTKDNRGETVVRGRIDFRPRLLFRSWVSKGFCLSEYRLTKPFLRA